MRVPRPRSRSLLGYPTHSSPFGFFQALAREETRFPACSQSSVAALLGIGDGAGKLKTWNGGSGGGMGWWNGLPPLPLLSNSEFRRLQVPTVFPLGWCHRTFVGSQGRSVSEEGDPDKSFSLPPSVDSSLGDLGEKPEPSLASEIHPIAPNEEEEDEKEANEIGDDVHIWAENERNYDSDDGENLSEGENLEDIILESDPEGDLSDRGINSDADLNELKVEIGNGDKSSHHENQGEEASALPSSHSSSSSTSSADTTAADTAADTADTASPRLRLHSKKSEEIDTKTLLGIERALLSGHSRMDVHDALHLLPSTHFVPLLAHLRNRKAWKAMLAVLEWMERQDEESSRKPKAVHYGHVLAALADSEQIDAAFRVFHGMGNIPPNNFHYTPLMHVCCKKGLFPKAEELLERMKSAGMGVSGVQYAVLTQSYAEAGNIAKAMEVFERMLDSECDPAVGVFNAIIDAFGKAGALEEMEKVCQTMKEKKLNRDQRTFNSMAHAYGRMGKIEKMEECYAEMVSSGFPHNRISYSCTVTSYARHGMLDRMEKALFEQWNPQWLQSSPIPGDVITSFLKQKNDAKALQLLEKMKSHGFQPDSNLLIAVLAMMCEVSSPLEGDWTPALRFLNQYESHGARVISRLLSSEPNSVDMQMEVREWFDEQNQRCESQNTKLWPICEWLVESLCHSGHRIRAAAVLWDFLLRNVHWGDLREIGGPWKLHLQFLQPNCAELLLLHWVSNAQWLAQQGHPIPVVMIVVTGHQKSLPEKQGGAEYRRKRQSFLLRESVIHKLAQWDAPFFCNEEKNPGLLIANGVMLEKWLTDPKLVDCLNEHVNQPHAGMVVGA